MQKEIVISSLKARECFSEILNKAHFGKEKIYITRRKKIIAVLTGIDHLTLVGCRENSIEEKDIKENKNSKKEIKKLKIKE